MESFEDNNYFDKVFEDVEYNIDKRKKTAFKVAHDVRKFEIELFWKRGTYFWAFILASFTAYFSFLEKMIGENDVSLNTFLKMPVFSKIILLVISGIAFLFCLSWVLVNKGSKFWQKNWEAHIDILEDMFSGKLYKTILNTKSDSFDWNPLRKTSYDYSVTKVTTVSSVFLTCVAGCLFIFHLILLLCSECQFIKYVKDFKNWTGNVIGVLVAVFIIFSIYKLIKCKGNDDKIDVEKKWRQRELF